MSEYDEFEKFVRHREFGKILDLAGRLKDQRNRLVTFASPDNNTGNATSLPTMHTSRRKSARTDNVSVGRGHGGHGLTDDSAAVRPSSRRGGTRRSHHLPQSIESSADLIRSAMIPANEAGLGDNAEKVLPQTIGRGEYPVTDLLVDETIKSLAEELKYCLDLKKQLSEAAAADSRIVSRSNAERIGNPPATKFAKWQIDLLQEWMLEHREYPFISQSEAAKLAHATGLDQGQVLNWVAAARRRHVKMTVDRERKPRDFLDFLFLATDRERHIMDENPDRLTFQNPKAKMLDALLLASVPMEQPALTSGVTPFSSIPAPKRSTQKSRGVRTGMPRYTYPRPPHAHTPSSAELIPPPLPPLPRIHAHSYDNARPVVTPYKPKNADHIFRRGKQLQQLPPLKERDRDTKDDDILGLPELPPPSWSFSGLHDDSDSQREIRLRANEQRLIEQYTPNGVIETPEGSLDGSFDVGDFDEDLFDKFYVPPLRHEDAGVSSLEHTGENPKLLYQLDAFNVNDVLRMPFDESEKDYLNGLL